MRIVFDVDGTLLRSIDLDSELYIRAFLETFGRPLPSTNWRDYQNATDRGIAEEAVDLLGMDRSRISLFRAHFLAALSSVDHIDEVPGAAALLAELRSNGVEVAIATGAWEAAARHKLRAGGIDVAGLPLVGSDDYPTREGILRAAIGHLKGEGRVIYVGDGEWDLTASRRLGVGFVGICADASRQFATPSVCDFVDRAAFARALASSRDSGM
jgi:phosphoglycolate phosphatase-like HAD superfamily hydrolase